MKVGDLVRMPDVYGAAMKVGDIVQMPGAPGDPLGVITRVKPDGIYRGRNIERVRVYWLMANQESWEPRKWLKVMNESH